MQPNKRRILCVDDNEDTCLMLTTLLERQNYEVASASAPEQALRMTRAARFDLYLLDTRFPEDTGLNLCRRIGELDPAAKVVFYSGAAYESDRAEGLSAGAQAYVAKPHIDKLLEAIERLLSDGERLPRPV
jgi:CheY-like chemotaxis protein